MCLRSEMKSAAALRWGLLFLMLANVMSFVGRRVETDIDFLSGTLFGVSFGLLLLSIWRNRSGALSL
jgi:hypothetical protein